MRISSQDGLEWLVMETKKQRDKILKSREKFGLSMPSSFDTNLFYGLDSNASGGAMNKNPPIVDLNIFNIVKKGISPEGKLTIEEFYKNGRFIADIAESREDYVIDFIKDPVKSLRETEKLAEVTGNMEPVMEMFIKKGIKWEDREKILFERAEKANSELNGAMKLIKANRKMIDWGIYGHEIDHVDFFNSDISMGYTAVKNQAKIAEMSFTDGKISSGECAAAKMNYLELMSKVEPLIEARAYFISDADIKNKNSVEKAKGAIKSHLINPYLEIDYANNILDALISKSYSEGEMDSDTSSHLFVRLGQVFKFNDKKVNHDLANKIFYGEFPQWKKKFAENINTSVDAIAKAYIENPNRLKVAQDANNFDDYIKICRG